METSIRHVKIFPDKFRTSSEILSDLYIADYGFEYNFWVSSHECRSRGRAARVTVRGHAPPEEFEI